MQGEGDGSRASPVQLAETGPSFLVRAGAATRIRALTTTSAPRGSARGSTYVARQTRRRTGNVSPVRLASIARSRGFWPLVSGRPGLSSWTVRERAELCRNVSFRPRQECANFRPTRATPGRTTPRLEPRWRWPRRRRSRRGSRACARQCQSWCRYCMFSPMASVARCVRGNPRSRRAHVRAHAVRKTLTT